MSDSQNDNTPAEYEEGDNSSDSNPDRSSVVSTGARAKQARDSHNPQFNRQHPKGNKKGSKDPRHGHGHEAKVFVDQQGSGQKQKEQQPEQGNGEVQEVEQQVEQEVEQEAEPQVNMEQDKVEIEVEQEVRPEPEQTMDMNEGDNIELEIVGTKVPVYESQQNIEIQCEPEQIIEQQGQIQQSNIDPNNQSQPQPQSQPQSQQQLKPQYSLEIKHNTDDSTNPIYHIQNEKEGTNEEKQQHQHVEETDGQKERNPETHHETHEINQDGDIVEKVETVHDSHPTSDQPDDNKNVGESIACKQQSVLNLNSLSTIAVQKKQQPSHQTAQIYHPNIQPVEQAPNQSQQQQPQSQSQSQPQPQSEPKPEAQQNQQTTPTKQTPTPKQLSQKSEQIMISEYDLNNNKKPLIVSSIIPKERPKNQEKDNRHKPCQCLLM